MTLRSLTSSDHKTILENSMKPISRSIDFLEAESAGSMIAAPDTLFSYSNRIACATQSSNFTSKTVITLTFYTGDSSNLFVKQSFRKKEETGSIASAILLGLRHGFLDTVIFPLLQILVFPLNM